MGSWIKIALAIADFSNSLMELMFSPYILEIVMVTFNFSFQPGMSLQQMTGLEIAGRVWGAYLTDDVTINLHIGVSSTLSSGILGGALPGFKTGQPYSSLYELLKADATSADDRAAFPAYQTSASAGSFDYKPLIGGIIFDKFQLNTGATISLTQANAKALETPTGKAAETLDGYIVINDQVKNASGQLIPWNYNYASTAVPSNTIDFLSTAIHEIGHILGFVSGVDRPWEVSPNTLDLFTLKQSLTKRLNLQTLLDTFRTSRGLLGLSTTNNLSVGGSRYFSLDSSSSALGYFATGKDTSLGGNGFQASHWRGDDTSSGIMNATLSVGGQRAKFSSLDLRAFDALGWELSSTGINTVLNWLTLQNQAKQALANRLGNTIAELDANPTLSAQRLSADRRTDVNILLSSSSDIYEGKKNGNDPSWQELFSILDQQGLAETLEESGAIKATRRNDILPGSTGDDQLSGLQGNDQLIGFTGNDLLWGNRGDDILMGNVGQDRVMGGDGDDILMGGRGRDRLTGGKGNDTLIGGTGSDIFTVQLQPGLDRLKDFVDGEDQLFLAGLRFEQLGIQQSHGDTLIDFNGKPLVRLENVSAHLITAADFV